MVYVLFCDIFLLLHGNGGDLIINVGSYVISLQLHSMNFFKSDVIQLNECIIIILQL